MATYPEYFAAHCEMQDAAARAFPVQDAAAAATVELAKLLTRFDDQIDDEWRAAIIHIGGGLLSLDSKLNGDRDTTEGAKQ